MMKRMPWLRLRRQQVFVISHRRISIGTEYLRGERWSGAGAAAGVGGSAWIITMIRLMITMTIVVIMMMTNGHTSLVFLPHGIRMKMCLTTRIVGLYVRVIPCNG